MDLDGLEVRYKIVNKRSVDVQKEPFDRFEVVLTVKNNTGKSFNIRLTEFPDLNALNYGGIVQFYCTNATGVRMTSKKETISMRQHNLKVTYQTINDDGKKVNRTMSAIAGFYFEDGDTRSEKVIPTYDLCHCFYPRFF